MRLKLDIYAKLKGWNLRQLAEEIGVDYQNVLNWNHGRNMPHCADLVDIADVLECSLHGLIDRDYEPGSANRAGIRLIKNYNPPA